MAENEIGTAQPRGRPRGQRQDTEQQLSEAVGHAVKLPDNAVVMGGPTTCPACGSTEIEWGCSNYQRRSKDEIHPPVWRETAWMADSYLCRTCGAGWIEPGALAEQV